MTVSSIPKTKAQHSNDFEFVVYRLSIKGSNATIVGTTTLKTEGRNYHVGQVSIQGNTLLAPYLKRGQSVGFWAYPAGGSPSKTFTVEAETYNRLWGLTISAPPSGAR